MKHNQSSRRGAKNGSSGADRLAPKIGGENIVLYVHGDEASLVSGWVLYAFCRIDGVQGTLHPVVNSNPFVTLARNGGGLKKGVVAKETNG
jgi:hypothetical protein